MVNYFIAAKSGQMSIPHVYFNVMEEYTQKAMTY